MLHELINWLITTIGAMGYPGIFLLMALESSIVPIPSEIIMPPAGYLVQQGQLNMALVILSGTLGSLFGAYLKYEKIRQAFTLGRLNLDMKKVTLQQFLNEMFGMTVVRQFLGLMAFMGFYTHYAG